FGRVSVKKARKHRLLLEGAPYRSEGERTIAREITFAGRTYFVQDRVTSQAELNYIYAGYQYDMVSRERVHAGLLAGVVAFDATGTLRSISLQVSATETESRLFPVAGFDFRGYPIGGRVPVSLQGNIKGMALGDYGHYVQASLGAG